MGPHFFSLKIDQEKAKMSNDILVKLMSLMRVKCNAKTD